MLGILQPQTLFLAEGDFRSVAVCCSVCRCVALSLCSVTTQCVAV